MTAARVSALIHSSWGVVSVFCCALAVWWLQAVAIPVGPGRDFGTYLGAYVQLFQSDPIDVGYLLGRTPATPLVGGPLLDVADGVFVEPAVSLLYALSITAWFLAARAYGAGAGIAMTLALLAYPGYGILFHELSSDLVFAVAFAGWSLLIVRVLRAPSAAGFAMLGLGVGVLALIRPTSQVLAVLVLVALVLPVAWRWRVALAAAFVIPIVLIVGGWTIHNGIRYDNYTFSRAGNMNLPFWRVFLIDRSVRPENGPKSRALAAAVRRDLLEKEPYRSYGITSREFFAEPTPRMWADLLTLSDLRWGWDTNHRILREVALEAVRKRPTAYASGVATTTWQLLYRPLFRRMDASRSGGGTVQGSAQAAAETVVVEGRRLPKPSDGEAIPSPAISTVVTPDASIRTVWTSPTSHHLVFAHRGDKAKYLALHRRMSELMDGFPNRSGYGTLGVRLNQASRWYLPPVFFLAVGIVALAIRRPGNSLALLTPTLAAVPVVILTAAGLPPTPHFTVPVAPAFMLLTSGSLLGASAGHSWRSRPRSRLARLAEAGSAASPRPTKLVR